MKDFLIIAPHVDDEIYSCMSIISHCLFNVKSLTIAYTCTGVSKQLERYKVVKDYIDSYSPSFVELKFLNFWDDGESTPIRSKEKVGVLDKLFESHQYIFIPDRSHHQDHIYTNQHCISALRWRNSLNPKGVFIYEYMYNHDHVESNFIVELTRESFLDKINILNNLNQVDSILSDESVNSIHNVKSIAKVNGSRINKKYGESFKVLRLNKLF